MQVCVLASGPSMCQSDAARVSDWRNGTNRLAIAVNNTFLLMPIVDAIFATDRRWWGRYYPQAKATGAQLWCQTPKLSDQLNINATEWTSDSGNSGERALRLAAEGFQATRIILIGFDMEDSAQKHWHGPHPKGWPNPEPSHFVLWRNWIGRLVATHPNIDWVNASRQTALECIPRIDLETAVCLS